MRTVWSFNSHGNCAVCSTAGADWCIISSMENKDPAESSSIYGSAATASMSVSSPSKYNEIVMGLVASLLRCSVAMCVGLSDALKKGRASSQWYVLLLVAA